jgi:RNA polymerase sigma-70 factor, ECF subfamily
VTADDVTGDKPARDESTRDRSEKNISATTTSAEPASGGTDSGGTDSGGTDSARGAEFEELRPLLTDPYQDPERSAELADSVSMAALLLLERLSPLERAVFVLREVFAFSFSEVAAAVGRSEEACRQLAVRARRHMDAGRPRFEADHREREELAERFFDAFREGDVDGLRELLAADVYLLGDAGGSVPQWRRVDGAANVARLLAALFAPFARIGCAVEPREVNGQPAAIVRDREDKVLGIWVLDILDGRIQAIRALLNPEKLGHVGPTADARAVIREAYQTRRGTQPGAEGSDNRAG